MLVSPTPAIVTTPSATVATCVFEELVAVTVSPSGFVVGVGALNVSPYVAVYPSSLYVIETSALLISTVALPVTVW